METIIMFLFLSEKDFTAQILYIYIYICMYKATNTIYKKCSSEFKVCSEIETLHKNS